MEGDAAALKLSPRDHGKEFVNRKLVLDTGSHGRPILQHDTKQPLLVLMAMVGLVLLIACANLAGLLIARGEGRQREIALRLALGAGRVRLVRQLMTESLILALAGGAAGLALASWTLSVIVNSIPENEGAAGLTAQLDYRVLIFACVVSLLTGVLFGLAPAIRATHTDLQSVLKDQGVNVSGGKANVRVRKSLMVSQIALTAVLLAAAGLFAHSLLNLKTQDLGVRPDHVLEFSISPELNRYTPAQTIALADRIRKSMEALPGVRAVSASEIPMLADSNSSANITVQGYNAQEDEDMNVDQNWVGPNFLATMGIPLLNGREFSEADSGTSPKVAIINEAMARRYFAGRNPIGLHFGFGGGKDVQARHGNCRRREGQQEHRREEVGSPVCLLALCAERACWKRDILRAHESGSGGADRSRVRNLIARIRQQPASLRRKNFDGAGGRNHVHRPTGYGFLACVSACWHRCSRRWVCTA